MKLKDAEVVLSLIKNPYERWVVKGWLDIAPTVDPVVHGEWKIKQDFGFLKDRIMVCSVCGDYIRDTGITVNCGRGDWNFRPNCGAKMDGGE